MHGIYILQDSKDVYGELCVCLEEKQISFKSSEEPFVIFSEDAIPGLLEYVINFPTAAMFLIALKYIQPIIIKLIKSKKTTIRMVSDENKLTLTSSKSLDEIKTFIAKIEESIHQEHRK